MTIDYEDDSNNTEVTKDDLSNITKMAASVIAKEKEVDEIEEQLKQAKMRLRKVQEHDLPDAMKACNMETFVTLDGLKVSVKETLYASIAAKNKPAAAKWLTENELGALVKEDITIAFDSDQHDAMINATLLLKYAGVVNVTTNETMSTASVKAAIKELLSDGKEVPLELFGAYFSKKATVK